MVFQSYALGRDTATWDQLWTEIKAS